MDLVDGGALPRERDGTASPRNAASPREHVLLDRVATLLALTLDVHVVAVWVGDDERQIVRPPAGSVASSGLRWVPFARALLADQHEVAIEDLTASDHPDVGVLHAVGARAVLAVALPEGAPVRGGIALLADRPQGWPPATSVLLNHLADQLADDLERRADRDARIELAVLDHELRNALTTVAGVTEMLERTPDDRAGRDRLVTILRRQVDRMSRLLDLSAANGTGEPPHRPVDVAHVIEDLVAVVATGTRRVERTGTRSAIRITTDVTALEQIVGNLLDNALRHADADTVRVGCRRTDGGVRIEVSDDGRGLPAAIAQTVLLPGVRGPGSSGEGLGLHVVDRRVRDLGGTLTVSSRYGVGTTIAVTLPDLG